jgi:hypothetical protein
MKSDLKTDISSPAIRLFLVVGWPRRLDWDQPFLSETGYLQLSRERRSRAASFLTGSIASSVDLEGNAFDLLGSEAKENVLRCIKSNGIGGIEIEVERPKHTPRDTVGHDDV